ncbi:MAG: ribosome small subunit-dependent GTPase A [Micromonosporaceae bacterium]|nr:ribosome small subunit-dependent GTPase A [Micromonosporaceae bacterium]
MTFDLASLGWDDSFAAAYRPHDLRGQQPARVSRVDRGVCTVLTRNGSLRASLAGRMLCAIADDPLRLPCVGDWVVARTWPDDRVTVEAVLPRRSAVVRNSAARDSLGQVLAANLDIAAVVEPMEPSPDSGRVERLLALAHKSGAQPAVILTKSDLAADPRAVAEQVADAAPGVPVHAVSAATGDGMAELRGFLGAGTTALLGPSGCGKSSLVNALAGATVMATRPRRVDRKGRHTTTYRALVPMPSGGAVLDTPGLRAVGLFDTGPGLERAFADIEVLAAGCRFADCVHDQEPDCAVRAAIDSGDLPARRLASWRKLRREHAWESRRRRGR